MSCRRGAGGKSSQGAQVASRYLYCNGSWFNKCTIKARDEQTVLSEITLEINYFLKHMELERKGINSTVGMCSRYNLVAVKAEEILRLYGEASSLVRLMLRDSARRSMPAFFPARPKGPMIFQ